MRALVPIWMNPIPERSHDAPMTISPLSRPFGPLNKDQRIDFRPLSLLIGVWSSPGAWASSSFSLARGTRSPSGGLGLSGGGAGGEKGLWNSYPR